MGVRGLARKVIGRLRTRRPRPAILMYHRVAEVRTDPWVIAVSPARFEEQMAYLRARRTPLALEEMVRRLGDGTLPTDAVGVTFDDGYLDNLVNAKPVLERHRVPATVFVATGFTGSGELFWWDELASMVLESRSPLALDLQVRGETVPLLWGEPEPGELAPDWRGWDAPRTARQRCHFALWSRLQSATPAERAVVLGELRQHLQAGPDALGVPMTAAQLQQLIAGGLVTLGGHTITHRALTDLDREDSRGEIRGGRQQVEHSTGAPVSGFAYPYGNVNPEVCEDARLAGFGWACTTEERFLNAQEPQLLALPRFAALDVPLEQFTAMLSG